MTQENERQEFQRWACENPFPMYGRFLPRHFERKRDGAYKLKSTAIALKLWQASRQQTLKECEQVVSDLTAYAMVSVSGQWLLREHVLQALAAQSDPVIPTK